MYFMIKQKRIEDVIARKPIITAKTKRQQSTPQFKLKIAN